MRSFLHDIRYGLRSLSHSPSFTIAALLTLALGIGATAAIFSVAYAVLLKPLPYPNPERLFVLASGETSSMTGEIFHHVRDRARVFENVAAQGGGAGWNLAVGNRAEYVNGMRVTRGYFDVIGVRPAVGRAFSVAEDEANGPRAAILSHSLSRRLFVEGTSGVGQTVHLSGIAYTVVGVMPPAYQPSADVELWTPARLSPRDNSWNYPIIARARPDVSNAQIAADIDAMRVELRRVVRDLSDERAGSLQWIPYRQWLGLDQREALTMLSGAVCFLLLIACVNVGSLQLVRAVARRREIATRAALGAGRTRLVWEFVVESVLLAICGGALGLLAAQSSLNALLTQVPEALLRSHAVTLDWRVAATVLGITVLAGFLFAVVSALSVARVDVRAALVETRQSAGAGTLRLRRLFAAAQIALAVVLLAGAGVLIRSLVNLRGSSLGFDPDNIVVGKMSLQGSGGEVPGGVGAFFRRTVDELRKVPGVEAVAVANNVPVERGLNLPIHPPVGGVLQKPRSVDWRWVSSDYFTLFRIPLRDGRGFDDRDQAQSPPVVVVNEAFARFFFGRPNVVGETVQLMIGKDAPRQIVGIVADVKGRSGAGWTPRINALAAPAPPVMYVPVAQVSDQAIGGFGALMSWVVRTSTSSTVAEGALRRIVQDSAPRLPFVRFETMHRVIARDIEMEQFLMMLLTAFAAAAMALAGVGIYGLTAYNVEQRTREIGIRMALGATRGLVLRSFLAEGFVVALAGLAIGIIGARFATDGLSTMIFGLTPHDPMTLVIVSAVLLGIAGVATLMPSLRAAKASPALAMRAE